VIALNKIIEELEIQRIELLDEITDTGTIDIKTPDQEIDEEDHFQEDYEDEKEIKKIILKDLESIKDIEYWYYNLFIKNNLIKKNKR
jgi:hypothetical protein